MGRVIRALTDLSQGHCFNPTFSLAGSLDVKINSFPAVRMTDNYGQKHYCGLADHDMGPAIEGSPNVFVNGLPIHRDGDKISCGDVADNGSPDVFANELGTGLPSDPGNIVGYTVSPSRLIYPFDEITVYNLIDGTVCKNFYVEGSHTGGVYPFLGDLFTPLVEEDTGNLTKTYDVPVEVTIFPDLPQGITLDLITGNLIINNNAVSFSPKTIYTVEVTNFVGSTQTQFTLGVLQAPLFNFNCD